MKRPCSWCGVRPAAYSVTEFCSIKCQEASWNLERKDAEKNEERNNPQV